MPHTADPISTQLEAWGQRIRSDSGPLPEAVRTLTAHARRRRALRRTLWIIGPLAAAACLVLAVLPVAPSPAAPGTGHAPGLARFTLRGDVAGVERSGTLSTIQPQPRWLRSMRGPDAIAEWSGEK